MTLRIQRATDRDAVVFTLSGRINGGRVEELQRLFESEADGHRIVLDLQEVDLVDRDAVRFLARCVADAILLEHCPAYRGWLTHVSPDRQVRGVHGCNLNSVSTSLQPEGKMKATAETMTDLGSTAAEEISGVLKQLLADVFVLYLKTKNFHWHMRGRHFRDYHLLLDEHAGQLLAMTDEIAERARKLGGTTLRSISDISRHQRLQDNNQESVTPKAMVEELHADNQQMTRFLRFAHEVCDKHNDVATASLIETWIDGAAGVVSETDRD